MILLEFLHQLVFFNQASGVFAKDLKRVKNLWRDGNRLAVTQQNLFREVKAKIPEIVEAVCFEQHKISHKFLTGISVNSQDSLCDKNLDSCQANVLSKDSAN